jgi:Methyltransferase domain
MADVNLRLQLRRLGNSSVGLVPKPLLRMFLKTFETRPEWAEAAGFHVHPRRFDSPLTLLEELDAAKLADARSLPGIELRIAPALELVASLAPFAREMDSIPYEPDDRSPLWFSREFLESFPDFDAAILYSLLRHLKPRRYVELGCGYSSIISSHALKRNHDEGMVCEAVYADPQPRLDMTKALCYGRLMQKPAQGLPLDLFTKLRAGDVLFIDTSHVLKMQSDVEQELLRIVPSLAPGVWIHFHDVFTPYDYPEDWVRRPVRLSCNEQYGVECLLSGGRRYQVEIPLHCLVREHLPAMKQFFPRGRCGGQSFWIRRME